MRSKKIGGLLALALAAVAMSGCGESAAKIKIGVGLYTDQGDAPQATKAFLAGVADELNCEFTYKVLSMTDGATNVTAAEELISAGCKGLIWTMDSAMDSVLKVCKDAGVYLAGYLCDYETSYDSIKDNPNFLGTVVDGRYSGTGWGQEVASRMIPAGYKNIGMIKFPAFAYPHQIEMDTAFRAKVAEYNTTAAAADKITLTDTVDLMFCQLDSAWLAANPDVDAIYGMCGGIDDIYPTLVQENRTGIKLYTAGFSHTDSIVANFGTKGTKTIQEMVFAPAETITYPLVRLVNKINGKAYSDEPADATRVDSGQVIVTSDEIMTKACNSIYATYKMDDAMITAKEVKNLLAANGGTEAKLVAAVQNMNTAHLS